MLNAIIQIAPDLLQFDGPSLCIRARHWSQIGGCGCSSYSYTDVVLMLIERLRLLLLVKLLLPRLLLVLLVVLLLR